MNKKTSPLKHTKLVEASDSFPSMVAARLWSFCDRSREQGVTEWIPLDEARVVLKGRSDSFKGYADFKRRVLSPALREVSETSDLRVELEELTVGRKVTQVRFRFVVASATRAQISTPKKNPYDKTSTKRSRALIARIKESGGAVVTLRADGDLVREIDALVSDGLGKSRPDLLANLVHARFSKRAK